jgi:hypothetical protein
MTINARAARMQPGQIWIERTFLEDQIGRDEEPGDAGKKFMTLRAKACYALRSFRVRGGGIALRIRLSFRANGLQRSFNPPGAAQWTLKL